MRTTTLLAPALGAALVMSALTGAPAHAAATCDGRTATIEVPATDYDTAPVVGTPGDDVIVGTAGRDTIDGAGGNDVICGLGGPDTLAGGEGDDRLFGGLDMEYSIDDGYSGDLVSPGPGNDHVDLGADPAALHIHPVDFAYLDRVVYTDAAGPVVVDLSAGTATGEGTDTIVVAGPAGVVGSAFDDRITGSPYDDLIQAGDGDDVVDGRAGDDRIVVDGGLDVTTSLPALDGGDDVADGGDGRDGLVSSGGTDQLVRRRRGATSSRHRRSRWASLRGGPDKDRVYAEGAVDVSAGAGKDEIDYQLQPGFRTEIDGDGGRTRSTCSSAGPSARARRCAWTDRGTASPSPAPPPGWATSRSSASRSAAATHTGPSSAPAPTRASGSSAAGRCGPSAGEATTSSAAPAAGTSSTAAAGATGPTARRDATPACAVERAISCERRR